jgi:hypothetical protein
VLDQFATGKAANLLSDDSSYTIEVIRLIVGAGTVLLFWSTRERFYLWFAFNLILESLFFPIDLSSAHQAWGLYFTTGILIDFLSQVTYIGFFVSALHSNRTKPILLPAALALLGEISIILVLKHDISLRWGDIGYCLTNIAVSIIIGWYLVRGWRAGNLYAKFFVYPLCR